jgi:peptidoglycan/LPS O-acetylase OafA/YrhL
MTVQSAHGQPEATRGADRGRYRPDIDGLRAVAVAIVVLYHAFPRHLQGGFIGVDVFFVISGYLISGIILGGLAAQRFSFADFYARRIRRIFPALTVVLAAVAATGWFVMFADDYQRLGRHIAAGAAFAANFVLWHESSYFDTAAELKPLLHLWSLGIEEQFYLIWPLLLVGASKWKRGPLMLTLALGTASFLIAIWTVRIDRTPAFFAPWTRFWELLAGAMLACIEIDRGLAVVVQRLSSSRVAANGLSIAGATMIAAGVVLIDGTRVFPGLWVLLPVAGTFLLIVAGQRAWINRTVLSFPIVVWVGLISYPLYLWHWPLLAFARLNVGGTPSASARLALIAISVVLAWATYRLVEWPIRFGSRAKLAVPAFSAAMVVLAAAGLATDASGGFIDRAINRSDAAHLVDYYERMRRQGLRFAYRAECDVMDWITEATRDRLDPSCTTAGSGGTVFLWGDSFAQALSQGIREQLPPNITLAQVTTSACLPAIDNFDLSVRERRCEKTNLYAMEQIGRLHPLLTIVAQSGGHAAADWPRLAQRAIELGSRQVLIVGPFPLWYPGLPRVFASHHLADRPEYVSTGVNLDQFRIDRQLAATLADVPNVTYVSLLERLCREGACLARVPGEGDLDLMAVDFGHLSPKGSSYVGRSVFKPYLDRLR